MKDINEVVQQAMEELDLPASLALDDLVARVETHCGKRLRLVSVSGVGWGRTTGLWLDFEAQGLIVYRRKDQSLYQHHSICHELGHIILHHKGCAELNGEIGKNMFKLLGQRRGVARLMARGHEMNDLERAAETIAFRLAEKLQLGPIDADLDEVFGS